MKFQHEILDNTHYVEVFLSSDEIQKNKDFLEVFLTPREIDKLKDEFVMLKDVTIFDHEIKLGFMYTLPGEQNALSQECF
jgi:hypothetical protein